MKRNRTTIAFSYAAAPFLVAVITWTLAGIQTWLTGHPEYGSPRAFTTLFFAGIALITLLGGIGPGLVTVGLSVIFTAYFVMLPQHILTVKSLADSLQLFLFFAVGSMITLGVEALITNRRLLSRSEEAQAKLRVVMDTAPVGVVLCEANGTLSYANREAERIWGHPLRQKHTGGRRGYQIQDPDGAPALPEQMILARALAGEKPSVQHEHLVEQADGTRVWVNSLATLIRDDSGNTLGALAIMSDVTARKEADIVLRARENRFRSLVQNASDIITVLAEDGTVLYKSPSEERILGFHPDETMGHPIFELMHPDDRPRLAQEFELVVGKAGIHPPVEVRMRHKNGEWRTLEATASNLLHDESIGGIVVNSRDITERKAAEEEIRVLLFEGLRQAEREMLLSKIAQTVLETPHPEAVLATTVAGLGSVLSADRCYYVSYNLAENTTRIGPEWHREGLIDIAGEHVITNLGFNKSVQIQDGQTQVVTDALALNPDFPEEVVRKGLRSLLRVPMHMGSQTTILVVAMAEAPRNWQADEVALVETVASQTRIAVEATRLQQREHNIATALQNALMPSLPEQVPGLELAAYYRPALEESSIGGDFHDAFPLDKGLFALVVGDVSGKGLAAASQVATVRQMLRYALYMGKSHGQSLAQSVSELNRQVVAHDLLMGFVTLFVAVYDASASRITYVCCGQEPALLRRKLSGEVLELGPTGPVLGVDIRAEFTEETKALSTGDSLAIYTDGMSEAGRGKQDLLGVEGIAGLMEFAPPGASALVSHLVSGMNVHAEGNLHDDVCLLVAVAQPGEPWPSTAL